MKMFEHEVVFFPTGRKRDFEAMQEGLRDWGSVGWEMVSVMDQTRSHIAGYTVFFKRELTETADQQGNAA